MEARFEAVAQKVKAESFEMYEDRLASELLQPVSVSISEVEHHMVYLSCSECYSLIWNDVLSEVAGLLDPKRHWLSDDPGTLYGPHEEEFAEGEDFASVASTFIDPANEIYARVMELFAQDGYVILPTNFPFMEQAARRAWVFEYAQGHIMGIHGEAMAELYSYLLEDC